MISFLHHDLTSLYKLIERLLCLSENEETQIIASNLPETFPDEIPFPPGATIIGSVMYRDEWHDRTQVFFDIRLEPQQLNNFYQNNLGTNWKKKEYVGVAFRSFSDSPPKTLAALDFVNLAQNIELNIEVKKTQSSQKESTTMVLLDIWRRSDLGRLSYAPLPILPSPPNLRILKASGGNGERESSAEAKLKTNLDLQELITHYAACFESEGWIENDSGKKENSVWQNWKMTDKNNRTWLGVLQITSLVEAEHYYASARVFQEENAG